MIKKTLWISIVFLLIGLVGMIIQDAGAFTIMEHVYRLENYGLAKNEASQKRQPIVFLYTYEETTCGLNKNASISIMEFFKDKAAVVYVSPKIRSELLNLPETVRRAINSDEAGRFIPRAVVANPDTLEIIDIIPYTEDRWERKAVLEKAASRASSVLGGN